jgi:membrane associated rhomboid family serine protease
MGIYDRDYYRREGPSFLGSWSAQGRVCAWLIAINIVCFFLQILLKSPLPFIDQPFTEALLLNVNRVLHGEVWRLLTYAFLHGSMMHILFNMLMLYFFGRQVEDHVGAREFLAIYLVSAVVAGLAYVGTYLAGWHAAGSVLGASGAVMAVLVMAALYNPRQVIYVMFIIPVPIWAFAIFMVASDAFQLFGKVQNGIAVSAHLGGAAFGFVYYTLHWRLTDWAPSLPRVRPRQAKPRLRLYREDEEPAATAVTAARSPAPARAEDEQLEAQMDAILAKIPRVGMEGLTENERELLLKASEAIKRRRG